jgi:hypothetical protein
MPPGAIVKGPRGFRSILPFDRRLERRPVVVFDDEHEAGRRDANLLVVARLDLLVDREELHRIAEGKQVDGLLA